CPLVELEAHANGLVRVCHVLRILKELPPPAPRVLLRPTLPKLAELVLNLGADDLEEGAIVRVVEEVAEVHRVPVIRKRRRARRLTGTREACQVLGWGWVGGSHLTRMAAVASESAFYESGST